MPRPNLLVALLASLSELLVDGEIVPLEGHLTDVTTDHAGPSALACGGTLLCYAL